MSKLYASIDSDASRTLATRRGHREISAHARGWNTGAEVECIAREDGSVAVAVYRTGGSNGNGARRLVAEWVDSGPLSLGEVTR